MVSEPGRRQSRRKYLNRAAIGLTAVGTTALAGCSSSNGGSDGSSGGTVGNSAGDNDNSKQSDVIAEDNSIVVVSAEPYTSEFSGGVAGLVENRSGSEASYVQVEVAFYEGDTKVGDGLDNTNSLPASTQWEYDATYLEIEGWDSVTEYTIDITAR